MRLVDNWLHASCDSAATSYDAALTAFAFAYASPHTPERHARACELLELAIEKLAEESPAPHLLGGASGTGFLIAETQRLLFGGEGEDLVEALDELVEGAVAVSHRDAPHDLVDGLVGLGVYARARLPRPWARRTIALIVSELAERAQRTADGLAWPSRKSQVHVGVALPEGERFWDTGLAHGTAGVCAWLASVAALDPLRVGRLLRGGGPWLSRLLDACYRLNASPPRFVSDRGWGPPMPEGWCYGATSCAVALMQVAQVARQPLWRITAELALLRATDEPGVVENATLCHGSAGLLHVCNRLGQTFSSQALEARARRWLERTLELCGETSNACAEPVSDALLTGEVGQALALMATVSRVDPSWDALLLLPSQEFLR
ncbi:MAG TPA: lanthionine synthetase LanC family protein [Polyangiaceae bacterium]|nr:lanthionine synthetase LanC family protein [Polyangiaceae bacterium]